MQSQGKTVALRRTRYGSVCMLPMIHPGFLVLVLCEQIGLAGIECKCHYIFCGEHRVRLLSRHVRSQRLYDYPHRGHPMFRMSSIPTLIGVPMTTSKPIASRL